MDGGLQTVPYPLSLILVDLLRRLELPDCELLPVARHGAMPWRSKNQCGALCRIAPARRPDEPTVLPAERSPCRTWVRLSVSASNSHWIIKMIVRGEFAGMRAVTVNTKQQSCPWPTLAILMPARLLLPRVRPQLLFLRLRSATVARRTLDRPVHALHSTAPALQPPC